MKKVWYFKIPKAMTVQLAGSMALCSVLPVLTWSEDTLFEGEQICGYIQPVGGPEETEAFLKEYNRFIKH